MKNSGRPKSGEKSKSQKSHKTRTTKNDSPSLLLWRSKTWNGTEYFKKAPDVEELRETRMDNNFISIDDEELKSLLHALNLKKPNNVRKIFLETHITAVGLQKLAIFLENNPQIESLEIWNEGYSTRAPNGLLYFVSVLKQNIGLKRLALVNIGAENLDASPFFAALKDNKNLEYLSLYHNQFESIEVAQQIADCIMSNTALKTLCLGGHFFGRRCKEGLALIARSLVSNTTLEVLDFSVDDVLGNEGAVLFANELAKNINLRSLSLFHSGIKTSGAVALANSLLTNNHLITLNLGCNTFNSKGAIAFAKALETNNTLQALTISIRHPANEAITALADMLDNNTSLMTLDYGSYHASGDGMDKLRIDIGLTRNRIAFLKAHPEEKDHEKELQAAIKKLEKLNTDYEQKNTPPSFADFVKWRTSPAGRGGCCASSFWKAIPNHQGVAENSNSVGKGI